MRARRLPLAGALVLGACTWALPLRAQEQGLFELRLTQVPLTRTVSVLLDPAGQPLAPLREVLEFLEVPWTRRADTLLLEWPPGVWSTRLELSTRTVISGGARSVVPAEEWVVHEGVLHLSLPALGRVLAAQVVADWENVSLLVAGRDDFPLVRRLRNEARRAGPGAAGRERRAEPPVPYASRSGGAAAGWGLSAAFAGEEVQGSARAALGVALLGGALEGGTTATLAGGARLADPFAQYSRAFGPGAPVRQLRLGDVMGDGLVTRPYFGFAASNEPLYAPQYFGEALLRPVVPAGWEYEVYQGGYLLGVSTRGASEPVSVPLAYGTTPLRVRLIGPAGQERVEELTFLVPAHQVPPGEWRWYAGGGVCRSGPCARLGYADVRRGLTRALTVGVGVDHVAADTGGAETRPYGLASLSPLPDLRTELRARAGDFAHLTVQRYGHGAGWQATAGWRRRDPATGAAAWHAEGGGTWGVRGPAGLRSLGVQARLRGSAPGRVDAWQASLSPYARRLQLGIAYESGFQPHDVLSVQAYAFPRRAAGGVLRDLTLHSRVDVAAAAGVQSVSLGATFRPRDRASVSASVAWHPESGAPSLSLSLLTRTPAAYVQSNAFHDRQRQGAFVAAGGGVAAAPGAGVVATPLETLGRGGVAGRVFLDEDGDGAWSPGEPPVAGVPLVVGGERTASGADGRFRAWGLLPYAAVAVSVDTLNLTETGLAPALPELLVRPTPNLFAPVDLALVRTREVMGRVRWRGQPRALAGITVEARRAGDGEPVRALTFSDGEFYFVRLPAGEYTLTLAGSSLRALNAAVEPAAVRFTVPAGAGDAPVQAPPLLLVRNP